MAALCHLGGLRRPVPGAVGLGFRALPRDHLHARAGLEPRRARVALAVREQGDGLAAFQSDAHRALRVAFAQGEIVPPQHPRGGQDGQRAPAQAAQQGVAAHAQVPLLAEVHPGGTPEGHAEGHEALGQPQRAVRPGGGDGRQACGAEAAAAAAIAAKPWAHPPLETPPLLRPGQVRQGAPIVTMEAPGWGSAQRTGGAGLCRLHAQGDLRCGVVDVTRLKAQERGIREQTGQDGGGRG